MAYTRYLVGACSPHREHMLQHGSARSSHLEDSLAQVGDALERKRHHSRRLARWLRPTLRQLLRRALQVQLGGPRPK